MVRKNVLEFFNYYLYIYIYFYIASWQADHTTEISTPSAWGKNIWNSMLSKRSLHVAAMTMENLCVN